MALTYYLRNVDSDLSAGGDDFNWQLSSSLGTDGNLLISVGNAATSSEYAFTNANVPGSQAYSGTYYFQIRVTTGNTNLYFETRLHRINAAGTIQSSSARLGQIQAVAGNHLFTFNNLDLGTWNATDRLRADYYIINNGKGSQTFNLGYNTTADYVQVPEPPEMAAMTQCLLVVDDAFLI